jgi:hypothetical protein
VTFGGATPPDPPACHPLGPASGRPSRLAWLAPFLGLRPERPLPPRTQRAPADPAGARSLVRAYFTKYQSSGVMLSVGLCGR